MNQTMEEIPAGAVPDAQYVVLDLDDGEPQFPERCVICGTACAGQTQRLRSLGHMLRARIRVVNRVFAVPVHPGRCRQRLLLSWWSYRFKSLFAFVLGGLVYFLSRPLGFPDSYCFAAGVVVVLVAIFALSPLDDRMPFKVVVWPDKSGIMSGVFYFKDEGYAGEFASLNRGHLSKLHRILKQSSG